MFTHIIVVIGTVYWLLLTARKHNFPIKYENWYDKLSDDYSVKSVLPKDFCTLCFVTQCSIMVSFITALVLAQPILATIIVIPCSAAYVIYLDNMIQ